MRPREFFASNQQHKRYTHAVDYATRMKKFMEKGYVFFDEDGSIVKGEIEITDNDTWSGILFHKSKHFTLSLLPFTYEDYEGNGQAWIDDTLKEIDKTFRSYRVVKPENIKQFY